MTLDWRRSRTREGVCAWSVRTKRGNAIVHDFGDHATVDVWGPGQVEIGSGNFPTADDAKARVETILDPRANAWDMVGNLLEDE